MSKQYSNFEALNAAWSNGKSIKINCTFPDSIYFSLILMEDFTRKESDFKQSVGKVSHRNDYVTDLIKNFDDEFTIL